MSEQIFIPKNELTIYYSEQNMFIKDISSIYSCSNYITQSFIKKYGLQRNYRNEEWLKQKHLVDKKKLFQMAEESNSSEDSIRRWMRHYNIDTDHKLRYKNMGRYSFDEDYFETIDNEEKAYWLGFIVADGCISVQKQSLTSKSGKEYFSHRLQILLSSKDRVHLEKFKEDIGYDGQIEEYSTVLNGVTYHNSRIRISSKKICDDLAVHGVYPRKSCNEVMPEFKSKNLKRHFIRGYFDGDGHFGFYKVKDKDYYSATVAILGGQEILTSILNEIQLYVFPTKTVVFKEKTMNHKVTFGGSFFPTKIMEWLYKDSTILLDRKYEVYQEWLTHHL